MSGSFAEALAAAFSKINEVPRATCKINKYWRLNASRNLY